jgi:hypothetical protein
VNPAQATFQALPSQAKICSTANPEIWRFLDPEDEVFFSFLQDVHDVSLTAVAVRRTAL